MQENTKDPCNKTHSPAQQKALARMKKKHGQDFSEGMKKQQESEGLDEEEASPQYCLAVGWKMQHAALANGACCIGHRSTLHPASHRTAFLVAQ